MTYKCEDCNGGRAIILAELAFKPGTQTELAMRLNVSKATAMRWLHDAVLDKKAHIAELHPRTSTGRKQYVYRFGPGQDVRRLG